MPIYPNHPNFLKTEFKISQRRLPGENDDQHEKADEDVFRSYLEKKSDPAPFDVQFEFDYKLKNSFFNNPAPGSRESRFLAEEIVKRKSATWLVDDPWVIFSNEEAQAELTAAILHCLPIEGPPENLHDMVEQALTMARTAIAAGFLRKTSFVFLMDITQAYSYLYRSPEESRSRGMVPASQAAVEALPKAVMMEANQGEECTICMTPFQSGSSVIFMPCYHMFHEECAQRWLMISNTCPICRHQVPHA